MFPNPSAPILLMEGGPFRSDESALLQTLQLKIRLYSLLFARVVIAAADFIESEKLYQVALRDQLLWTRNGIVSIALPDDVTSLDAYIDARVVPGRRSVDRGRRGRKLSKIVSDAKRRSAAIGQFVPTLKFDVASTRRLFKQNTLDTLRRHGEPEIAKEVVHRTDFYRGLIMEKLENRPSAIAATILRHTNAYYYLSLAMQLHAGCALQRGYTGLGRVLVDGPLDREAGLFKELIGREGLDYFRFLQRLVTTACESMEVDASKILNLPDPEFVQLLHSPEAHRFRSRIALLLQSAKDKTISESKTLDTVEAFHEAFSAVTAKHAQRERKWQRGKLLAHRAVMALSICGTLSIATAISPSAIMPGTNLLTIIGGLATLILDPCLQRLYAAHAPAELSLFVERYREVRRA
jgi:hypothetical protein